ncbi:U32 family peptidase [bacterium]|nr:U32 family peptidase [bacterium]
MKPIELLAPAKDIECGIAAIDCGADAIYIGAPRFGARSAAGNNLDDIASLAEHAHKYWAKVYVTVNTLLRDDEIDEALRMIRQLYDIGADGIIIQDTALLECDLPPIPIIASTQMHNNTPEKVSFLEQVGINRVILARELSLDQIKAIRTATKNIELEFFVHGALCVCYSGQCYMSYALGGRSGNRGECAQPCRKPYDLVDNKGKTLIPGRHLLSLKDLNLSEHLSSLIEAGVTSFKIEGRLKERPYVANVVSFYRQKLDDLGVKRPSSGASRIDIKPDVNKTFNRGYTTYFLHGRDYDMGSIDTPKMVGEAVGKVTSVSARGVTVDANISMHNGDGICFFDSSGDLRGSVINNVRGRTIIPDKLDGIEKGTFIFRNHDHEYLTRLQKSKAERLIDVSMSLHDTDTGLCLTAEDEDGNTAEYSIECEKVIAQKPEQTIDNINKQLSKLGGTIFTCTNVTFELSDIYFIPISVLNSLRRGVLDELIGVRAVNRPIDYGAIIRNDVPYPETYLSYRGNVLNICARRFYERHGVSSVEPAAESGLDMRGRKVMTTRYCIKRQIGLCGSSKQANEPLFLVDSEGHKLELRFDCSRCEMDVILVNG